MGQQRGGSSCKAMTAACWGRPRPTHGHTGQPGSAPRRAEHGQLREVTAHTGQTYDLHEFKACLKTNLTQLKLNYLNHAKEGTSAYHKEQKYSIDL